MLSNLIRYQKVIEKQLDVQLQAVVIKANKARTGMNDVALEKLVPVELTAALDFLGKERQDLEATFGSDMTEYLGQVTQITMAVIAEMGPAMTQMMQDMADQMEHPEGEQD